MPSITTQLTQLYQRPITLRDRQRAALHWLDWMGCAAAGAPTPVGKTLRHMAQPAIKGHKASLLGYTSDSWLAVLLDAGTANVEEMDDMHREAILHPGPVILPAVASFARQGLPASRVLDAIVVGYETMIRIGRSLGPHHYFHWHNTATAGAFGAAAACASAQSLTQEQTVWALGNAGTQAAGLWQVRMEPVMSKQLHPAQAAWAGRTAAQLAQHHFTGPQFILEGERGFFAAMCPDGNPDAVLQEENDWLIHTTSFKPWPACRHTHATIDCVLALREQLGNQPLTFEHATVRTFNDAVNICNQPAPQTRTQAKFSLQYCVAAAARFGALRPEHFDESWIHHPDLQAAAARVEVIRDSDCTTRYPAHYSADVQLRTPTGSVQACVQDALGDPECPLRLQQIYEKAEILMAYGDISPKHRSSIHEAVQTLMEPDFLSTSSTLPAPLLTPLFTS